MKVLKTAAIIVAVVAAVVMTAGALAPAATAAVLGSIGVTMATVNAVAAGAALLSAGLNMIAPAKPKGGSSNGTPTEVKLDPQAGMPYLIGRSMCRAAWAPA